VSNLYPTVNDFDCHLDALEALAEAVDNDLSGLDLDPEHGDHRCLFPAPSRNFGIVVEVEEEVFGKPCFLVTVAAMSEPMEKHERVLGRFDHLADVANVVRSERLRNYR
jgi:hypothetical protein